MGVSNRESAKAVLCSPLSAGRLNDTGTSARGALSIFNATAPSKKALRFGDSIAQSTNWPHQVLAIEGPAITMEESAQRAAELAPRATVSPMCEKKLHKHDTLSEHAVATDGYALVVMGAFAQSRLHDLIFGAATAKYLKAIAAPVALVH